MEASPTDVAQASVTESPALPPRLRNTAMLHRSPAKTSRLTPSDAPVSAEALIQEARTARDEHSNDQVALHIRAALAKLKRRRIDGS